MAPEPAFVPFVVIHESSTTEGTESVHQVFYLR